MNFSKDEYIEFKILFWEWFDALPKQKKMMFWQYKEDMAETNYYFTTWIKRKKK